MPETFLAARVGVGDELDPVGEIDLLEALREQLEHLGARLLCALDGDGNRDPPDGVQRNALFSLSKNPSPASYVSVRRQAVELLQQPALLLRQLAGDGDVDEHALVAAAEALQHRQPAAAQDAHLPGCVPGSNVSSVSPSSVGTATVAPSAACVNVRSMVV